MKSGKASLMRGGVCYSQRGGVRPCPPTCQCILRSALISCNCADSGLPPHLIRLFTAFLMKGRSWSRWGGKGIKFVQIGTDKSLQNTIRGIISMDWSLDLPVVHWFSLSLLPGSSLHPPYLLLILLNLPCLPLFFLISSSCIPLSQTLHF